MKIGDLLIPIMEEILMSNMRSEDTHMLRYAKLYRASKFLETDNNYIGVVPIYGGLFGRLYFKTKYFQIVPNCELTLSFYEA